MGPTRQGRVGTPNLQDWVDAQIRKSLACGQCAPVVFSPSPSCLRLVPVTGSTAIRCSCSFRHALCGASGGASWLPQKGPKSWVCVLGTCWPLLDGTQYLGIVKESLGVLAVTGSVVLKVRQEQERQRTGAKAARSGCASGAGNGSRVCC